MRGRAKAMRRIRVEKGKGCIFDLGVGELWNWKRLEGDLDNRWGEAEEVCCGGLDGCVCVKEGGGCAGTCRLICMAFHPSRVQGRIGSIILLVVLLLAIPLYG